MPSVRRRFILCCAAWLTASSHAAAENPSWVQEALRSIPILNLGEPPPAPTDDTAVAGFETPHPAVARIVVPEPDGTTYGSGTLVDARGEYGLVVTNWHVVETVRDELWVEFADGFRSAGKLLKVDRDWDLAAIAIWRPHGAPVSLAKVAPLPGDELVIAGFGNGPFRAARGQCLQYVTPSLELPLEMVQVTAAARNGDSGGPIFNAQGELAGVLFGTGEGVTSGSYCGRVNQFLASVLPKEPPQPVATLPEQGDLFSNSRKHAAANPAEDAAPAPTNSPDVTSHAPPATVSDFGLLDAIAPPPSNEPPARDEPVTPPSQPATQSEPVNPPERAESSREIERSVPAVRATTAPASATADASEVNWLELAGATTGERLKTALAMIGACTLIWHTVRLLCGPRGAVNATS